MTLKKNLARGLSLVYLCSTSITYCNIDLYNVEISADVIEINVDNHDLNTEVSDAIDKVNIETNSNTFDIVADIDASPPDVDSSAAAVNVDINDIGVSDIDVCDTGIEACIPCINACTPCIDIGSLGIEAEFLYCTARIDSLEYALHVNSVISEGPSLSGEVDKQDLHFNWDPGVRVGFGYDFGCNWSTFLIGTYLHSRATASDSGSLTDITNLLQPLWFQSFTGVRATTAEADWDLKFATIDLIGMRTVNPFNCWFFDTFLGLRSVLIKQSYNIDYSNNIFTMPGGGSLAFPSAQVDLFSRYLAIGLNGGTNCSVPLRGGFYLNGSLSGSLVYGKTKVVENIEGAFPVDDDILIPVALRLPTHAWNLRANFEIKADISYTRSFRGHPVDFFLGYFFSIWFDQYDFYNLVFTSPNLVDIDLSDNFPTVDEKHANLQIQGLQLGATIHF